MTETFETNTTETDPQILIDTFFKTFPEYTGDDEKKIRSAWSYLISKTGQMKRGCGKPYYLHPMPAMNPMSLLKPPRLVSL